jgi:hypothetical protein
VIAKRGLAVPMSDLFGPGGRQLLAHLLETDPWFSSAYPGGARFTLHMNYRTAEPEWANRIGWGKVAIKDSWHRFVNLASLRQVLLFGFPPPGHPYWTPATVEGVAQRYPGLDLSPWRNALAGGAPPPDEAG